jgi:hypothetical protein
LSVLTSYIFNVNPIFADHGHQDIALGDSLFYDFRKLGTERNGVQIAEDLFFAELMGQTIVEPPSGSSAVVPSIADEYARHYAPKLGYLL